MASKVIKSIEGKFAGKSFQSLLQIRGKFGSVPSQQLYKKEVLRAVADSDPNMRKAIYGGSFVTHEAGKTFTKALQHVHGGEGKLELTEKAKRMLGLRKGEEIKGEKAQMVAKKLVTYFRQEAADAAPKTDEKDPAQVLREKRVAAARRGMNLYQTQKERAELESGKRADNKTSITTGEKSATTATKKDLFKGGTIAGASETAGQGVHQGQGAPAIPGQHATPPAQSRGAVPIIGGVISHAHDGRDRDAFPVGPTLVGAADARGVAADTPSADAVSGPEGSVPTPGLKTDVTDIRSAKKTSEDSDDDLPSTEDIDRDLPLAA